LILIVVLGDLVAIIPMAALVAIMVMVSVGTFDWHSIKPSTLKRMPKSETAIMLITVAVVVATSNLAIGVVVGVFAASVMFVRRVAHLIDVRREVKDQDGEQVAYYTVEGQLLFASSNDLPTLFEYTADPDRIIIDLSKSHIWDASTVAALDTIQTKYREHDKRVEFVGMNEFTTAFHSRLTGELGSWLFTASGNRGGLADGGVL